MRYVPLYILGDLSRWAYWPALLGSFAAGILTFLWCPFVWAGIAVMCFCVLYAGVLALWFRKDLQQWVADQRRVGAVAAALTTPIMRYWSVWNLLSAPFAKAAGFGLGLSLSVILTGGLTLAAFCTLLPALLCLLLALHSRLAGDEVRRWSVPSDWPDR